LFDIIALLKRAEATMILVTRLDRQQMYLNPDHIISVEETPDTVITLFNGHHILIRESASVLINRIISYRTRILRRAGSSTGIKYLDRARTSTFSRDRYLSFGNASSESTLPQPLHTQDF
jgi:flagellar protein FlbD